MAQLENGKWTDNVPTTAVPTRAQYMNKEVTHNEYYLAIARDARVSYAQSVHLPRFVSAIRDGDEHLNTVYGLSWWDSVASGSREWVGRALKAHGDFWSLSCGVCTHKAAARHAAMAVLGPELRDKPIAELTETETNLLNLYNQGLW